MRQAAGAGDPGERRGAGGGLLQFLLISLTCYVRWRERAEADWELGVQGMRQAAGAGDPSERRAPREHRGLCAACVVE